MDPSLLSVTTPGSDRDGDKGAGLPSSPPLPPGATRPAKKHMMELMGKSSPNMGADAANPFIQQMMGIKAIEDGVRQIVTANPKLSPIMSQILTTAQSMVISGMAGDGAAGAPGSMPPTLAPPGMPMGGPQAPPPQAGPPMPPPGAPPMPPPQ